MTTNRWSALQQSIEGELYLDDLRRGVYSTDASIYQIIPSAVVYPKSNADLQAIVKYASETGVPILARGGGTSLAGQAVSEGIVIDFTKYMHQVLEYNSEERWIRVQPGISRDEVNTYVAGDRLEFAPDPATSSRATVGGMIANNSSGTKSILYGKTSDHVLELTVLDADGRIRNLKPGSVGDHASDPLLFDLHRIVKDNKELIKEKFPKTMRRVNGYPLDELLEEKPWNPQLIYVGSEGTLGIILDAKINLVPLPKYKAVGVVQFANTIDAVKAVEHMLPFDPAAIEILSDDLLNYSKKNLSTKHMCEWIDGSPMSVQIVEFYSDTREDIEDRAGRMFSRLEELGLGYAFKLHHEGETYDHVWSIRKRGLGLLMGEPNDSRGIAFIEDAAVPVEKLPAYIERVLDICASHEVEATYYAHASVGVIHVRPLMNLRDAGDIDKMKTIARQVFDLVVEYGGAWSGEHGDGLVRSPFLQDYFGEQMYSVLREVKQLFDPRGIFNPGKIIDPPPMDKDLRYGPEYHDGLFVPEYQYRDQKSFHTAVHQCTGIGSCRKVEGGTMCPSYMATREEVHSTRGRANALRLAMSGQMGDKGLADPAMMEAMDLCLSCKACKAECPSSVDMARLKSEVLQVHYDKHGTSLRDRLIRDSAQTAARIAGPFAGVVNRVQKSGVFRKTIESVAGIDRRRVLPTYAQSSFTSWFKSNYNDQGFGKRIGLFADTYLNYHEPSVGQAAVHLIQKLGFDIDLLEGCCQRPRISHGFLKLAKKAGASTCDGILAYDGIVLAVEPGCASALTDDMPDLMEHNDRANAIKSKVVPIGLWLADQIESADVNIACSSKEVFLHGHCHQKALVGTGHVHRVLRAAGAVVYEPDSGCCGMGGSFGYEKEHYEISKKLAERVLLKDLVNYPDAAVAASGFSCRHQIEHFSGRKVVHWLELLE